MTKDRPPLTFSPNLAFGIVELRADHGGVEEHIPSWLLDRPDVLSALAHIAANGGTAFLKRLPDGHDVLVDPDTGGIGTCMWTGA